jgi:hypothetical protein
VVASKLSKLVLVKSFVEKMRNMQPILIGSLRCLELLISQAHEP